MIPMKNLLKVLALGMIMLCSMVSLNAQKQKKANPMERSQSETSAMIEALQLDEATGQKVAAINEMYAQKMKAQNEEMKAKKKAGEDVDRGAMKQEMKAMNKAKVAEIEAILGKEKAKEYKAFRKSQNKGRKGMNKKGMKMEKMEKLEKDTGEGQK